MRKVTLEELRKMGEEAKGSIDKIYLHWSAGWNGQFSDKYHVHVDGDGSIHVSTDDLTVKKNHTYCRNTGSIGISLACCALATSNDLGEQPPSEAQIEVMSQIVAVLSKALDLTIDINNVMTHGEAGDNEDGEDYGYEANGYPEGKYGPKNSCERWDLAILANGDEWGSGGNTIRGKANYYLNKM